MQNFKDHKLQRITFDIFYYIKLNTVLKILTEFNFRIKDNNLPLVISTFHCTHRRLSTKIFSILGTNSIDLGVPQNILPELLVHQHMERPYLPTCYVFLPTVQFPSILRFSIFVPNNIILHTDNLH